MPIGCCCHIYKLTNKFFMPMEITNFGKKVDPVSTKDLLRKMANLLGIKENISAFIGSHPLTLTMNNIKNLLTMDYLVCEKSDGIRALLFITDGIFFFYDRKNMLYKTPYITELKGSYLFDGELYKEIHGNETKYIFAVFDSLVSHSQNCLKKPLLERLSMAKAFFNELNNSNSLKISDNNPFNKFKIIIKTMTKSYGLYEVLDSKANLKHGNDGLIFTPLHEPYLINSRSRILKWKPPELNTVDMEIEESTVWPYTYDLSGVLSITQMPRSLKIKEIQDDDKFKNPRSEKIKNVKFASFYSSEGININTKDFNEKGQMKFCNTTLSNLKERVIGEFSYNKEKEVVDMFDYTISIGGWELHKIRTDKNSPNNIKVIIGILESISENICEDTLRNYWKEIRHNYKLREQAQKKQK